MADERYVHPRHGICHVIGRRERQVDGGSRAYVELQVDASPTGRSALTMLLPEDELLDHVRPVVGEDQAGAALRALADRRPSRLAGAASWRIRVARAEAVVEAGDLVDLARVLRDFAALARGTSLSNSERRTADHIRDLVVGELVGAMNWTVDEAVAQIDQRLASAARGAGDAG